MLSFFESIIEFFQMLFDIIINFFNSISTLISVVSSAITVPISLTGFVHPLVSSCILAVLLISVFKLVLGWGNS